MRKAGAVDVRNVVPGWSTGITWNSRLLCLHLGRTKKIGGEILKDIVAKLCTNPNLDPKAYSDLSPAKLGRLVESDSKVRDAVNEQDQKLLRLLIIFQHGLTVIVLLVSAALVGPSVWLFAKPQPLSVLVKSPTAVNKDAEGLRVDLDPVDVEWQSQGVPESVRVYLENVDSRAQTDKKTLAADIRNVVFTPEQLHVVASDRPIIIRAASARWWNGRRGRLPPSWSICWWVWT